MPDGPVLGGEPDLAHYRAALEFWLRDQCGDDALMLGAIKLLPGGAVQRNWRLDLALDGQVQSVVLRAGPDMPLPESRSKSHEFMVVSRVHQQGLPVAAPLWLESTGSVIGREFMISEFRHGDANRDKLFATAASTTILAQLASALAGVHAMDAPAGVVMETPRDRVKTLKKWARELGDVPEGIAFGLNWLSGHAPETKMTGVVHRDFRTGNFLIDGDGLSAILDWEFAGAGDVHEDIGWFCARCWRGGHADREAGGLGSREVFYRAYMEAGGMSPEATNVRFWEVFAHVRWALIAMQQRVRSAAGEYPVWELEEAGNRVPGLSQSIQDMLSSY
jgi:aminoglycoside phosphotransferase (APT) family kinase protein